MIEIKPFYEALIRHLEHAGLGELCQIAPISLQCRMDDQNCPEIEPRNAQLAFVFLPYELVMYRLPPDANRAHLASLLHWVHAGPLTRRFADPGINVPLFYKDSMLVLASSVLVSLQLGDAACLCSSTAEVHLSRVRLHPKVQLPECHRILVESPKTPLKLVAKRLVGPSGRECPIPDLAPFLGPLSVIAAESASPLRKGLPNFITQVRWMTDMNTERIETVCGGKHQVPSVAQSIARIEALERFQVIYADQSADLAFMSPDSNPSCVAFEDLAIPAPTVGSLDEESIAWTTFTDLHDGSLAFVPAQDVWFEMRPEKARSRALVNPTTSGAAIGSNLEESVLFALIEYIERDAYLSRWYLRKPALMIDAASLQDDANRVLLARIRLSHPNYQISLYYITLDVPVPIVTAVAERKRGTGGKTFHATAAALTIESATKSALGDIAMMLQTPYSRSDRKRSRELVENPSLVVSPEDHKLLYMDDKSFANSTFLLSPCNIREDVRSLSAFDLAEKDQNIDLRACIETIVNATKERGMRVLAKDITHNELRDSGLFCTRVIVTQMSPMWYGSNCKRIPRSGRLSRLDHTMPGPRDVDTPLFTSCHPFS